MGLGSDMYRQQILDHYKNPRNYGELEDADIEHVGENPMCGDTIKMFIQLADDGDTIEHVSFVGDGCAISQASASMLSGELRGRSMADVEAMDRDDIVDMLGVELSPMRIKCAVLAEKVAQDGIAIHNGEIEVDETTTE
ncbi:MAG: iron-sulfur cluster assembly scaffold protein [Natronomonas sp.]|jgi:nitrogen fixation NifU-like protein|uniref:iron-sulfur cluster assembly scaffold protein n=1 Tax=Natronomonas sp. TaxID=2184060 RepID=UPI0028707044|nr:iron-sulfur cluster assembly scaffold protein [Natronomonas sp.]MDR9429897.1 iron-sulfur cluster assembly scaffold protein [Natronomonas sp.]